MPQQDRLEITQADEKAARACYDGLDAIFCKVNVEYEVEKFLAPRFARHRHAALKEAAKVAESHADDRGGRDHPLAWHDGYLAGCRNAAAAIRTLPVPAPLPVADLEEERDWVITAAGYTLDEADNPISVRDENGQSIEHAAWMLYEIVTGNITGRKAHRWLGYAQGLLVMAGYLTLDEAKLANKRASDESRALSTPSPLKEQGE